MAVQDALPKKSRRSRKKKIKTKRQDRLSSLPHDILIDILSELPLQLAVVTSTLSWRWRNLWKNLHSIHITNSNFSNLVDFFTTIFEITMQITSPVVQSFSLEFVNLHDDSNWSSFSPVDPWLRQICNRNVCQLKLAWPKCWSITAARLPEFVLKTQSLVSLELSSGFDLQFPDQINLPNLKTTLSLVLFQNDYRWLEKLTLACPSLEELSLNCYIWTSSKCHIKCSNQNLRRLKLNTGSSEIKKVIVDAPKLDYLSVCTSNTTALWYGERPIVLREVKIEINITGFTDDPSDRKNNPRLKWYRGIRRQGILTLDDVVVLSNISTIVSNVPRLTISLKMSQGLYLLSILEMCPVLDFLTLRFEDEGNENKSLILPSRKLLNTNGRVLKRIEVETQCHFSCKPTRHVLELSQYLLSNTINLEHFKFSIIENASWKSGVNEKTQATRELNLCRFLYQCPMVSMEGEVEFVGNLFTMSRKAGPYVHKVNGGVIPLNCLP